MNTREKVLVTGMVLTVLYGGYTIAMQFVRRTPADVEASGRVMEDTMASALRARVEQAPLQPAERHVLQLATTSWESRPFGNRAAWQPEADPLQREYRYTGFCQVGDRRLAIINGRDYLVGDDLPQTGYTVKSIDAAEVWLKHVETGEMLAVRLENSARKGEVP